MQLRTRGPWIPAPSSNRPCIREGGGPAYHLKMKVPISAGGKGWKKGFGRRTASESDGQTKRGEAGREIESRMARRTRRRARQWGGGRSCVRLLVLW